MKHEADQIINYAQAHYATQNPNPERTGCAQAGQITSLIWTGRLPEQQLRQHLLGCSECFREYRAQLASYQVARQITPMWWQRWKDGWHAKAAFAFSAVLLISLGGWFIWQQMTPPLPSQIATNTNANRFPSTPASSPSPEMPAPNVEAAAARDSKPIGSTQMPAPLLTRTIDLNEYVALRDVQARIREEQRIRLASEPTRLKLNLPEGSAKGTYAVHLIDAFGRSLRRVSVLSPTGKTLTVTLDLSKVSPNNYRLQIARGNEAPDYYPVTVTEKHSKQR